MEIDSNCGIVKSLQIVSNPDSHIVNREVDDTTVKVLLISRRKTQTLVTLSIPDKDCTMLDLLIKMDISPNRPSKIYLVKDKSVDLDYIVEDSQPGNYLNSDQGCSQESTNQNSTTHVSSEFEENLNCFEKTHKQFYSNNNEDNQSLKSEQNESKAYKRDRKQDYQQFTVNTDLIDESDTSTDSSNDEIFPTHNLCKSNFTSLKVVNAKENTRIKLMPKKEVNSTCDSICSGSNHKFGNNENVEDESVESEIENMTDNSNQVPCVSLMCKRVFIGSYHYGPNETVIISQKGMEMRVPLPNDTSQAGPIVREKLGMKGPKGPYYDSLAKDDRCRRIILLLHKVTKETKLILESLFTPNNALLVLNFSDTKTILGYALPAKIWKPIKKSLQTTKKYASRVKNSVTSKLQTSFKESQNHITLSPQTPSSVEKSIANKIKTPKQLPSYANESVAKISAIANSNNEDSENDDSAHRCIQTILIYPPAPARDAITINDRDCACLGKDKFINDVIIDFYLKYLSLEVLLKEDQKRTHVFSSHFYKRLTHSHVSDANNRLLRATKRHSGVQKWTKDVNIFEKDFIIIPINERSHWIVAIICFPGLAGEVDVHRSAADDGMVETRSSNPEIPMTRKLQSARKSTQEVWKLPCILIFDSLHGFGEYTKVLLALQEYLSCEYLAKTGIKDTFFLNMTNAVCPEVPQQSNSSDCGIYLLHYVERFFQDPIKDYNLPIKGLKEWFDKSAIVHKRKEIYDLIMSRR
ncbi:uncharacterized protein LOC124185514 isoform X5 [Neodiprion fabricii]|uniref:uncharacterized protein LOC124185514 isoform X5 n=1 Tax=Neodiprion fabricii TaxID=2872261 RepID=UPI001ED97A21|nr:uncharacterized protein LOC124185514 isoform X5 [Neodiprion fabricii]